MSSLGPHAGFIIAAYGLTATIVVALVIWVLVDGRVQRRRLSELEARGVRRRSSRRAGNAESAS